MPDMGERTEMGIQAGPNDHQDVATVDLDRRGMRTAGDGLRASIAEVCPLVNPRLSEVDWDAVAAAFAEATEAQPEDPRRWRAARAAAPPVEPFTDARYREHDDEGNHIADHPVSTAPVAGLLDERAEAFLAETFDNHWMLRPIEECRAMLAALLDEPVPPKSYWMEFLEWESQAAAQGSGMTAAGLREAMIREEHVRTPEGPDDYCTGCGELWPCAFEQGWSAALNREAGA